MRSSALTWPITGSIAARPLRQVRDESFAMTLGSNHRVVLANWAACRSVIADAVKFVRDAIGAAEIVIDNTDAGVFRHGSGHLAARRVCLNSCVRV